MRDQRLFTVPLQLVSLLLLLMGGCHALPSSPSHSVAQAAESPFYPPVSPEVQEVFKDIPRLQANETYQEYDGLKVAQFVVYSSGKVENLTFNEMTFPALWVYDATRKNVVQYPLVLALPADEGKCTPFYQPAYDPPAEWLDCQIYLTALEPWIQRGKLLFPAITGEYVFPDHIAWEDCTDAPYCTFGRILSAKYASYDIDRHILQRSLSRVPKGWVLAWTFGSSEEILPALSNLEVAQ